jgi:hypothetical protein
MDLASIVGTCNFLSQGPDLTLVERYGVLGLLTIVLVGIGAFLVWVGRDIVISIRENTKATSDLATEMRSLKESLHNEFKLLRAEMAGDRKHREE